MKDYWQYLIVLFLFFGWANVSLAAAGEGFLSNEAAQTASADELLAEVAVFKSIRQGLTLSVTLCETTNTCDATPTSHEVQQIIDAIDKRVDGLSQRQQDAGNSAGLEDVLVAYGNERSGLSRVLKKIGDTTSSVVENIDEAELFDSATETESSEAGAAEEFGDMFADEDEDAPGQEQGASRCRQGRSR